MNTRKIVPFLMGVALFVSAFANPQAPEKAAPGALFSQSAKLNAEGSGVADHFGYPIAMDGDVIVVGSAAADPGGVNNAGAAYVYVRQGSGWFDMVQVAVLTASDKRAYDGFGGAVAIDGDTIVVGAPAADPGGVNDAGAVYYFTKPATGWAGNLTETGQLFASDNEAEDDFGFSVAIDNGVIAVGALDVDVESELWAGVVYLYINDGSGWSGAVENARLYASDYASGDWFGYAVDIDSDVIAVGAKYSDSGGYALGSAYVFVKPADGWVTMTESAKLLDSNPEDDDRFGGRIGISGDTIVVGADGDNPGGAMNAGAAFVYVKPAQGWSGQLTETAQLTSSDKEDNAWNGFGTSAAIDGDIIVVGSQRQDADGVINAGVVYIFEKPAGGWQDMTETDSVTALDKHTSDEFGVAVAISGNTMAVGSWLSDRGGFRNTGAAYVFDASGQDYQSFISNATQDGYILEAGATSEVGYKTMQARAWVGVGDTPANRQYRAILAFDTSSLPDNAVITAAILKIKRTTIKRGDPFQSLNPLIVDIRSPNFGDSAEMVASDFQAVADLSNAGVFGAEAWGWLSSELEGGAFAFINFDGFTQFRLRFAINDNDNFQSDFTAFYSGEAAARYRPVLIVKYTIP